MVVLNLLRLLVVVALGFLFGKLASKLRMPAVLGFLIAGMVLGPNAANLLTQEILDAPSYGHLISVLECGMGLMLGTEMVWKRMRSYGMQVVVITLTESLGTFVVVSAAFCTIFYLTGVPVFLGLVFGGIALATAPAPALSIVTEYHTAGPVTRTLIPLAVLDDVAAIAVFLGVMSVVLKQTAGGSIPSYLILLVVLFPVLIGLAVGIPVSALLRRSENKKRNAAVVLLGVLAAASLTMAANAYLMPFPILNFMLTGMVYSAVFSNRIPEQQLDQIMTLCAPMIGGCFTLIILNLGAPLDYHLILDAGLFTAIYILSRAVGKIGGAAIGARMSGAPDVVQKYLGFTLMPHSGVSLVLTGIAISSLTGPFAQYGDIVRGTIAAAAVINEVIAVFLARKGFQLAGELGAAVPAANQAVEPT
jgi:Kef-type K+ transport system membrane component KefB